MTYYDIECFAEINGTDENKVNKIADSIKKNGWVGCPILVYGESLLTGTHRLAALKTISEDEDCEVSEILSDMDVAEDVTEIVEGALSKFEEENGYVPDIQFDSIGWLLEGSWVEEYKNEIVEW